MSSPSDGDEVLHIPHSKPESVVGKAKICLTVGAEVVEEPLVLSASLSMGELDRGGHPTLIDACNNACSMAIKKLEAAAANTWCVAAARSSSVWLLPMAEFLACWDA